MSHFRRLRVLQFFRTPFLRFYILASIFILLLVFGLTVYNEITVAVNEKDDDKNVNHKVSQDALTLDREIGPKKSTNLSTHKEHLFIKMNLSSRAVSGTTRKNMLPVVSNGKIYGHHNDIINNIPLSKKLVGNSNRSENSATANATFESLERRYGWIAHGNTLPNYFLTPRASEKNNNQETTGKDNKNSSTSDYSSSVVVFLHHNKAAGSSTKMCLKKIISSNKLIQVTQTDAHQMSVLGLIGHRLLSNDQRRIMTGDYSFGLCDHVKNKCAYFTFLRNPWNRLISSYEYCKHRISDQLCSALNASSVSIKEWALHQGSFFFRQLIYNPDICSHQPKENVTTLLNHLYPTPCWYRQKVKLDKLLTKLDLEQILSYVLSKLEQWFAVIGLVEDYKTSTELLQEAFGLPFHSLCSGDVYNSGQMWLKDKEREKLRLELTNDPQVNEAMSYDLRIYKTAQDIFRRQKEEHLQQKVKFNT